MWGKKPDNAAVADVPKFNPANPCCPMRIRTRAIHWPARRNLMQHWLRLPARLPLAGDDRLRCDASRLSNSAYPTTPYQQAKLPATAGTPSAGRCAGRQCLCRTVRPRLGMAGLVKIQAPRLATAAQSTMPSRYAPGSAVPTKMRHAAKSNGLLRRHTVPQPLQQWPRLRQRSHKRASTIQRMTEADEPHDMLPVTLFRTTYRQAA